MTVADLIQRARYEDPSFTATRHTDHVLAGRLADYQKHLARRVADLAPEELAQSYDIAMPLADHNAGHTLIVPASSPAVALPYLRILNEGEWSDADGNKGPIEVIANEMRFSNSRVPPIIIRAGKVYPRGSASDWAELAATNLRIFYIPLPADTVALDAKPLFHDLATDAYVRHLASAMASRSRDSELARPKLAFRADANEAEEAFLAAIVSRHVMSDRVRQVW